MPPRSPVLAGVVMAFLASRLLGLHFHALDHDQLPFHETVAHVESEANGHHLDDHLVNGDQDVEAGVASIGHQPPVAAPLLLVFLVLAGLTAPQFLLLRAERPAFRPPRSRRNFLLPPPQGPPLTV